MSDKPKNRRDQIEQRSREWAAKHPEVGPLFDKYALALAGRGSGNSSGAQAPAQEAPTMTTQEEIAEIREVLNRVQRFRETTAAIAAKSRRFRALAEASDNAAAPVVRRARATGAQHRGPWRR